MGETHTRMNRPKSQEKDEEQAEKHITTEQQTTESMGEHTTQTETKTAVEGIAIPPLHEELKKEGELSPTAFSVSFNKHIHTKHRFSMYSLRTRGTNRNQMCIRDRIIEDRNVIRCTLFLSFVT